MIGLARRSLKIQRLQVANGIFRKGGAVNDARTKLNQAIADPKNTGNVKIDVANDDLRLGRTALLPDAFVVEGTFNADVTATLEAVHL